MARPVKNNCDYFPHDAGMRNHPKVKSIRQKFVNGYSIWSMLLEYLTAADGNEFEHSEMEYELMSGDFGVPVTEIKEVVAYCIKLEMLFEKSGFIYSDSLNERLAPVYIKRGRLKELSGKQRRRNGKYSTETPQAPVVSVTETPQRKGKESKEDESRGNNPRQMLISEWFESAKTNHLLQESFCKNANCAPEKYLDGLTHFFVTNREGETWANEKDFKSHLSKWAKYWKPTIAKVITGTRKATDD